MKEANSMNETIIKVRKALEKNNMAVHYAENSAEVISIVKSLINKGDTVSCGGSVTLADTGVDKLLKNGEYNFLDRSVPNLTVEQINDIYTKTFAADAFFCSANAVTEQGELVNVDGRSNRVAALLFGPKKVVCIVGINKIVADIPAAFERIKRVAAPLNTKRLSKNTPCFHSGQCVSAGGGIAEGCHCDDRICSNYVISAHQTVKNRINVIICNETLGY